MARTIYRTDTVNLTWEDHDLEVDVECSPFHAAVTSGPPERCCPAEGGMESIQAIGVVKAFWRDGVRRYARRNLPAKLAEKLEDNKQFMDEVEEEAAFHLLIRAQIRGEHRHARIDSQQIERVAD